MRVSPGWGWLLLPVCRALVAPREVSGRLGETLSVQCWYARGYERYNKYWCRGASRDSCRKVVETAGLEAPQRRSRVSITDKQVFCVILLTVEHLSEEDAGSYWCGIERLGKDIMEPVKVAVFPAAQTPMVSTVMNSMELPNTTNATSPGSSRTAMTIVVPSVVLASLLVAAGSAVLIWTLVRRRKEAQQRPLGDASRSWQDKLAAGSQAPGDAPPPRSKAKAAASAAAEGDPGPPWLCNVYSNSLEEGPVDTPPPPPRRASAASTHTEPESSPWEETLYENAPQLEEAPGSEEETDYC